jgi:D-sedoheptulose 7-phosphate isomerase
MSFEEKILNEAVESFSRLPQLAGALRAAADLVISALRGGNRVFFCGNGGSAADSQHLAAELLGKFLLERAPLPAIALTVDTSALTAIGNDYGYDQVFARQLRGLGRAGDVIVGLSTSGKSRNVVEAFVAAREIGIVTIGLTGEGESAMTSVSDLAVRVPATSTPRIQEMHIAFGHALCQLVEAEVSSGT